MAENWQKDETADDEKKGAGPEFFEKTIRF